MGVLIFGGRFYRSKAVLGKLVELKLVNKPHLTPDGYAVMTCDLGDAGAPLRADIALNNKPVPRRVVPTCLVPMAEDTTGPDGKNIPGGDLLCLTWDNGRHPEIRRVELLPDSIPDLEPLVEYDHLPEYRKDYKAYPKGLKLA